MSGIRADVEISAGVYETIRSYSKISYDIPLNGVRYFDVLVDASGADYRSDFARGRKIEFYFNEILELKGEILKRSHASTGELRLQGIGFMEKRLGNADCATQAFSATTTTGVVNSDTGNFLSKVTGISAGTIENQTVNNFRSSVYQKVLEGISRLTELTGQDWSSDDANDELDIEDHKGSSSTIGTLTDGIDIKNVFDEEDDTKKILKITVLGKGFGSNQVTGSAVDGWSQGDAERTVINRAVDSDTEANDLAAKLLAIEKLTRFKYSFTVVDPYFSFTLGDVVTLDVPRVGLDDTNLRIVKFKRVITQASQRLMFEVRATGERESAEDSYKTFMLSKRSNREAAMTQPSDDGTGSISDGGHLHADGTYGADNHLHSDGTYSADSNTSANNPVLARDSASSQIGSVNLDSDGSTYNSAGTVSVSGMNDGDYALLHVVVNLREDVSGDNNDELSLVARAVYNSVTYTYPFVQVYATANGFHNTIGTFVWLIPLEPTSDTTIEVLVKGDSDQDADYAVNVQMIVWSLGRHTHSVSSTGVSGNSANTQPGVAGNSASNTADVSDAGHSH